MEEKGAELTALAQDKVGCWGLGGWGGAMHWQGPLQVGAAIGAVSRLPATDPHLHPPLPPAPPCCPVLPQEDLAAQLEAKSKALEQLGEELQRVQQELGDTQVRPHLGGLLLPPAGTGAAAGGLSASSCGLRNIAAPTRQFLLMPPLLAPCPPAPQMHTQQDIKSLTERVSEAHLAHTRELKAAQEAHRRELEAQTERTAQARCRPTCLHAC